MITDFVELISQAKARSEAKVAVAAATTRKCWRLWAWPRRRAWAGSSWWAMRPR